MAESGKRTCPYRTEAAFVVIPRIGCQRSSGVLDEKQYRRKQSVQRNSSPSMRRRANPHDCSCTVMIAPAKDKRKQKTGQSGTLVCRLLISLIAGTEVIIERQRKATARVPTHPLHPPPPLL